MGRKVGILLSLGGVLVGSVVFGASWEDVLQSIDVKQYKLYDDGKFHEGVLYNARVIYNVLNGNNNSKLEKNERVYIKVISGKIVVETPEEGLTRDELKEWAKAHADELIKAVFSGDPSTTFNGQSTSVTNANAVVEATSGVTTGGQTTIIKKSIVSSPKLSKAKSTEKKGVKKLSLTRYSYTSLVLLKSEKADIKFRGYDGTSTAGFFKYSKDFGEEKDKQIGFLLVYRLTDMDDPWSTKSYYLSFLPYFGKNFYFSKNKIRKFFINTNLYLMIGGIFVDSKAFPNGAGYLEYGGGFSINPTYKFNKYIFTQLQAGYQYSKKYIPESMVSEELKFIAEAVNNMEASQIGLLGFKVGVSPIKNLDIQAGVLRTKELKGDSPVPKSTYYYASANYTYKHLSLGIGYKFVQDAPNYDEKAYMAGIGIKW